MSDETTSGVPGDEPVAAESLKETQPKTSPDLLAAAHAAVLEAAERVTAAHKAADLAALEAEAAVAKSAYSEGLGEQN